MSCIDINLVYVVLKPSLEMLIFIMINLNYKLCVFLYGNLGLINTKKFKLKKWALFLIVIGLHAYQILFP